MRTFRYLFILLVIITLVTMTLPAQAQGGTPPNVGLRPDAPTYALHGPFWVGYKNVVVGKGADRPLNTHLWYPAINSKGEKEDITYKVNGFKDDSLPTGLVNETYGHALLNAEVDASKGPYPLLVFSHGFGTSATWYSGMIEHYTSYGFIVIAPEHIEKFDLELSDLWKASIDRPLDIKRVLDYAEKLTAAGGDLAGLIDMQQIAVIGHSYGGYTALAMAGAPFDLAAFNVRCEKLDKDDPLYSFLCVPLITHEADMAARAGINPMPTGLWPSFGDSRIKAIIPMAGDSYLFDKAGLAKITIPMMAMGGTADNGTPYEWGIKPAYENASSIQKALVSVENADHLIFMTACRNLPWVTKIAMYTWYCFESVWDKDRVADLINHFSTAFLLDTLKGDTEAHKALLPEAATFAGINYKTTMK